LAHNLKAAARRTRTHFSLKASEAAESRVFTVIPSLRDMRVLRHGFQQREVASSPRCSIYTFGLQLTLGFPAKH